MSAAPVSVPAPAPEEAAAAGMSKEDVERKTKGLLSEFYSASDLEEAKTCVGELTEAGADLSELVEAMFTVSLDLKTTSWPLLSDLLASLAKAELVSSGDVQKGVRELLNVLDDVAVDAPKAPAQLGGLLGALVAEGAAELKPLCQHILEAEGEDETIVASGTAGKVVTALLREWDSRVDAEAVHAGWTAAALELPAFFPEDERAKVVDVSSLLEG
jgi:hypothetical protein